MSGKRVTLVDLDLQFGDLGLVLGLDPAKTIYDLAVSGGTLDAEKVRAFTAVHSTGLRVLLAPVRPDQASVVTPDFLRELYAILRESNDIVVVDTPPGFNAEVIATIDASSHVCLLGMLDAPSIKNAKLGLETLDLMGYPHERIRLVLNRADTNVGITHADVVRVLGKAPDVLVPSTRDVVRAINAAEPIVMSKSRTEAGKAFQALADLFLTAPPVGEAVAKGRGARSGRGMRLSRS
jgi:pilus assembly protein CpaE